MSSFILRTNCRAYVGAACAALLAVALLVAPAQAQLLTAWFENFNDDFGDIITQDAGKSQVPRAQRVDDTLDQQYFSDSPGVSSVYSGLGIQPWGPFGGNGAVFGDGALQLVTNNGANKASTNDNLGVFGIGKYSFDIEVEAFYGTGNPPTPPTTRPGSGFKNTFEKLPTIVILSDSFTGDTNAPNSGLQISVGQGADQGFRIKDMQTAGKPDLASYVCGGGDTPGLDCSGDPYRPWQDGSLSDRIRQTLNVNIEITEPAPNTYHLSLSYGAFGEPQHLQVSGLDVTSALSDVGGHGVPNGYWNLNIANTGSGKYDNLNYNYNIPEPSSLMLLCLGGLGFCSRRKHS